MGSIDTRAVTHTRWFQANALEKDALEELSFVRSIKSPPAPINRTLTGVRSLNPDHQCNDEEDSMDRGFITLTRMSFLEGCLHLPFRIVGFFELRGCRQSPHLRQRFQTFPIGDCPRKGHRRRHS